MVPTQVAQQGSHLVPVPAVVRFGPRSCGEAPEEPLFPVHYERVRDVCYVRPVPCHVAHLWCVFDKGGTAICFCRVILNLTEEFLAGKAYGTLRHEEPAARAKAERVQVAIVRFPDEEPPAAHTCRGQAVEQVIITLLRDFPERFAERAGIASHEQCHALGRHGGQVRVPLPFAQLFQRLTAVIAVQIVRH